MIPMMTRMVSVMSHRVSDFLDWVLMEEESHEEDKLVIVEVEKVDEELVVNGFF